MTLDQISKELKALRDQKGFLKAGLPKFNRLFGRDALISAWQLLDKKPEICRSTLETLSLYQGKEINDEKEEELGKILHEFDFELNSHPEAHFPFPYYGSIDATPLYLIIFSFYYKKTKDNEFLDKFWQNILLALEWIEKYGDKDKDLFIEYQRKNPNGVFHQSWKDDYNDHLKIEPPVAMVEVQGYQYLALKEMSEILRIKKDFAAAKRFAERAKKLKKEFNKKFWIADKKYFAFALDGKKQKVQSITSNPGHLLFCEIVDKNKIKSIVKRLFEDDLFTPFGIRTHSSKEPDFDPRSYHKGSIWPHDNWIIAQGLKKLGFKKEYDQIKSAILRAWKAIGYLPEFYGVIDSKITLDMEKIPCYPQAWSSGAIFNFLSDDF